MKVFVGVTDSNWFAFLRARTDVDEVNFWQPSGSQRFRALGRGDLFLFKLHYPENMIVGGGAFVSFDTVPMWLAWDAFKEKNGAASFEDMRERVGRYRRSTMSVAGEEMLGCIILSEPFFLDDADRIPAPADWAPNIVRGKTYDGTAGEGSRLLKQVIEARGRRPGLGLEPTAPVFGEPILTTPRIGQGAFKLLVVDAYERRCAVSGEKALPVLDAAHIYPVAAGGMHRVDNGLLLRSDIHTLFDRGYATITPQGQFRASRRLTTDYDNGAPYYAMEHKPVMLPELAGQRPAPEFLEWHNDVVFLG